MAVGRLYSFIKTMENKKVNYPFIITLIIFVVFAIAMLMPHKTKMPVSYNDYTAGQLLDVKIWFDKEIKVLTDKRQVVLDIYYAKRGYSTGEKTPIEQVDEALGLK